MFYNLCPSGSVGQRSNEDEMGGK